MINLTFGRSKFQVRILYKSGNEFSGWFVKFKITPGEQVLWETVDNNARPLIIGIDDIEAVFQTDARVNIFMYFILCIKSAKKWLVG